MYDQVGPMPWKSGVFVGPPEDGSLDPELLEYFWERDIRGEKRPRTHYVIATIF